MLASYIGFHFASTGIAPLAAVPTQNVIQQHQGIVYDTVVHGWSKTSNDVCFVVSVFMGIEVLFFAGLQVSFVEYRFLPAVSFSK